MFTDEHRRNVWDQIRQRDLQAFQRLLTPQILAQAATRAGLAIGRGPLCLFTLAYLSIACALQVASNFAQVLDMTLKLLGDADSWARGSRHCPCLHSSKRCNGLSKPRSRHDPRGQGGVGVSEEAFVQARNKAPIAYWRWLILLLGESFQRQHEPLLRWRDLRLLALDGTTLRLQNWQALRQHFGTAANASHGRKAASRKPQARMVMLTFPLARLPWKYELCPLSRSEKTCAASLLDGLQRNDLVLMDKGFWSYGLFCQIASQNAFFAIRLFKSAKFKTLQSFAEGDQLVRWTPTERKWKKQGLPAHIDLRVIRYQVPGYRPTALVTNLIDRRVNRQQWVGLATEDQSGVTLDPGLYHRRWEIETTFKEMKVHQKLEQSLRGRTPRAIEYEVAGHVLLYLLVRWLIVEAALAHEAPEQEALPQPTAPSRKSGPTRRRRRKSRSSKKTGAKQRNSDASTRRVDPLRLSFSNALHELTDMAPALILAPPWHATHVLVPRLLERIAAHRVPWRPGRHYPRPGESRTRYKGRGHYCLPAKLGTGDG